MGAAGGIQTIANLLSLERGVIPRIRNLDEVGIDPELVSERLDFLVSNRVFEPGEMTVAIAVSKGFGGFNAAEVLAGPHPAHAYLIDGTTERERERYAEAREARRAAAARFQEEYLRGAHMIEYDSSRPITAEQIVVEDEATLRVEGYAPMRFGK
jgi:hypothetical protein